MEIIVRTMIVVWVMILLMGCHPLTITTTANISQSKRQTGTYPVHNGLLSGEITNAATHHTLHLYPLRAGSTWVYRFRGYDQEGYVLWELVESVKETSMVNGTYMAEVECVAHLVEGNPAQDFPSFPERGIFYYLVDGEYIYILQSLSDSHLSKDQFVRVFPLPDGKGVWYPNRAHWAVAESGIGVSRQVSDSYDRALPMGDGLFTCYHIAVEHIDYLEEAVFCETVGFVHRAFHYQDRLFGWWAELVSFSFK